MHDNVHMRFLDDRKGITDEFLASTQGKLHMYSTSMIVYYLPGSPSLA
jgi:hypothetical protein